MVLIANHQLAVAAGIRPAVVAVFSCCAADTLAAAGDVLSTKECVVQYWHIVTRLAGRRQRKACQCAAARWSVASDALMRSVDAGSGEQNLD